MRVILIRHAIAEERDEVRWPDIERPLSARGRRRFHDIALGLAAAVPDVDALLSSPYVRAWDSARMLHRFAHWPEPRRTDALIDADPDAVGEAIAEVDARTLAFVGHEPGMSALAAWLLGAPANGLRFRKGAAACLEVDAWARGSAHLERFAPPSLLRLAGRAVRPTSQLTAP